VQHLLLIMVAPALLVVGSPLTLLLQVTRGTTQQRVRSTLLSAPVSFVTHPIVGFLLYAAIIIATHLTSFMQQMMLHPWLHQAEHVLYLGGGYLFLLPLLGNEPIRWQPPYLVRLVALFIAMAPETVVGIVLLQANHELFPAYAEIHRMWGPTPLQDLNRGGGIMWAFGDGLMMVFIIGVMLAYITHASTNATAGGWLEGVRRSTLAGNLEATGEQSQLGDGALDEDEAALAAYNRMLGRLNDGSARQAASGDESTNGR
jgi:cytochrome c oxidase assembly factor CtaG